MSQVSESGPISVLPDVSEALFLGEQHSGAGLADALQSLDGDFEVPNVEDWQLQMNIACRRQAISTECHFFIQMHIGLNDPKYYWQEVNFMPFISLLHKGWPHQNAQCNLSSPDHMSGNFQPSWRTPVRIAKQ